MGFQNESPTPSELYNLLTNDTDIYMGILKNIFGIVSMRFMNEMFNEEQCIKTLKLISGAEVLDEMPHYDTKKYKRKYGIAKVMDMVCAFVYPLWIY